MSAYAEELLEHSRIYNELGETIMIVMTEPTTVEPLMTYFGEVVMPFKHKGSKPSTVELVSMVNEQGDVVYTFYCTQLPLYGNAIYLDHLYAVLRDGCGIKPGNYRIRRTWGLHAIVMQSDGSFIEELKENK